MRLVGARSDAQCVHLSYRSSAHYEAMDMPSNGSAPHTSHCQIPLGNRNPYF